MYGFFAIKGQKNCSQVQTEYNQLFLSLKLSPSLRRLKSGLKFGPTSINDFGHERCQAAVLLAARFFVIPFCV